MSTITAQDILDSLGEEYGQLLIDWDPTLKIVNDQHPDNSGIARLAPEDVAIARACISVLTGSALLNGDRKAIKDAATLYGLATRANILLIGKMKK